MVHHSQDNSVRLRLYNQIKAFLLNVTFLYPLKTSKPDGFLKFLGGKEMH